jgi:hypothetical protein
MIYDLAVKKIKKAMPSFLSQAAILYYGGLVKEARTLRQGRDDGSVQGEGAARMPQGLKK